jgi:branched-chain amino acid transport system substrate-binding protein
MSVPRRAVAVLCAVAAAFSLSVARSATTPQGDPVQIGAILSITGPAAFLGKNEQTALGLIEEQVNRDGGIGGRPLKFVVEDDQSSPQLVVQIYNRLAAQKLQVILGPSLTATCAAVAPLVTKESPLLYCFSPGFVPENGSKIFTWGPKSADLVTINVRYYRERGIRKLAFITPLDAQGLDAEHALEAALQLPENKDMSLVAREHFNGTDISVTAQIARIKASGAQALIAWGVGTPAGTELRSISDGGLTIPVAISSANLIYTVMKQFGPFLPRDLVSASFPALVPDSLPNGAVKNAVRRYNDAFKAIGIRADATEAIAWDPGWIVVTAYRRLGPDASSNAIKDFIDHVRGFAGATGLYDFQSIPQRGLAASNSGIMVRWDPDKEAFVAVSKLGGAPL